MALTAIAIACNQLEPPALRIVQPPDGPAFIQVVNLSAQTLAHFESTPRSQEEWTQVLRVAVTADSPPMAGNYRVVDRALRFTPAFPFDPGRPYAVRFGGGVNGEPPLFGTMTLSGTASPSPETKVTAVYPSGAVLPENLLRMYIHFSAPMGLSSGIEQVELLDDTGAVVEGAFLPLDYEFWDADRTRFTVFFDPGRVKRGILPNRQRGRALRRGGRYTLVVKASWRDGNGLPLREEFRRTFTAGPAEMQPLGTAGWKLEPGDSLVVTFPKPLDRGLLMRALGVRRDGQEVDGEARVEAEETRWVFTPSQRWTPGRYELVALSILEDPAGNQIGKAFEIDNFETVDKSPDPKTIAIPFELTGS